MTKVIPFNAPGPDILLCGDVERNPGPHYGGSTDSLEISHEDLLDMKDFQEDTIQERLRDASDCKQGPPLIYPLVLHPSEDEHEECHVLFQRRVPHHILEALANLALPEEVAEPRFLLMINRTEAVFDGGSQEARGICSNDYVPHELPHECHGHHSRAVPQSHALDLYPTANEGDAWERGQEHCINCHQH
jgi:hypothetical protein